MYSQHVILLSPFRSLLQMRGSEGDIRITVFCIRRRVPW